MVRQVSVEGGVMRRNGRLTSEDKLRFLSREWGYAEITKVILALSGDQKFLVKNYRGKLPADWNTGDPLPGNPRATRMIEVTAYSEQRALHAAYWKTLTSKEKGNGSSRPKALTTQFLKV
jgi:hypothetical protein